MKPLNKPHLHRILWLIAIIGMIFTIKWGTLFILIFHWAHLYQYHPEIYMRYRYKYEKPQKNIKNFPKEFKN